MVQYERSVDARGVQNRRVVYSRVQQGRSVGQYVVVGYRSAG